MSKITFVSKQSKQTAEISNREKILQKKEAENNDFWVKPLDGSVDRFKMVAGPDPCGPCTGPCVKQCSDPCVAPNPCTKPCNPCQKVSARPDPCSKPDDNPGPCKNPCVKPSPCRGPDPCGR